MDKGFASFRKDLNRILDGTDEEPGILRKLDKIDGTNRLLRKLVDEEELKTKLKEEEWGLGGGGGGGGQHA